METEQLELILRINLKSRKHQFIGQDYTAPLYFNKSGFLTLFYKDLNIIFNNGLNSPELTENINRLHIKWLKMQNDGWSLGSGQINNNLSEILKTRIIDKSYGILSQKTYTDPVSRLRAGCVELENNLIWQLRENRRLTGYTGTTLGEFTKWVSSQGDFKKFEWLNVTGKTQNYREWLKFKIEQEDYKSSQSLMYGPFNTNLSNINVPCIELELEELILACMLQFNKTETRKNQFPPENATLLRKGLYGYG